MLYQPKAAEIRRGGSFVEVALITGRKIVERDHVLIGPQQAEDWASVPMAFPTQHAAILTRGRFPVTLSPHTTGVLHVHGAEIFRCAE